MECAHVFSLHSSVAAIPLMNELLDIGRGRAITDDGYVKINMLVEVQGTLDASNDPIGFVAERSAAEQRKKHAVVSIADRMQDRRTHRCLIGCLENKPCECRPKMRSMLGI